MIHPADTQQPSTDNKNTEDKVPVERNVFGYLVNVLLAIAWLSLFLDTFCKSVIFLDKFDLIHRISLGSACLILGSFHAYILCFDKGESDNLKTRIIKYWPLVLGMVLYVVAVCDAYAARGLLARNNRFQKLIIILASLNIPQTICFIFLSKKSNIFSPWTVKKVETNEVVYGRSVVGFLVSIVLALIWLAISIFSADEFKSPFLSRDVLHSVSCFLIHMSSLVISGSLLHNLCRPNGEASTTWEGYFKKKNSRLMVSGCAITLVALILSMTQICHGFLGFLACMMVLSLTILLALSSCSVLIPGDSSQSWTSCFKPWNAFEVTKEVSV